jgi:hypothetical protein
MLSAKHGSGLLFLVIYHRDKSLKTRHGCNPEFWEAMSGGHCPKPRWRMPLISHPLNMGRARVSYLSKYCAAFAATGTCHPVPFVTVAYSAKPDHHQHQ